MVFSWFGLNWRVALYGGVSGYRRFGFDWLGCFDLTWCCCLLDRLVVYGFVEGCLRAVRFGRAGLLL